MITRIKPSVIRIMATGALLIALAASVFYMLSDKTQHLLLINERTGKLLYEVEAIDGTEFSIVYIHSVNKSPVTEYYQVIDGQIYLIALRYASFGAGMPTELTEGLVMSRENDSILITGYDRHIPYLCYVISRIDGHSLDIGGVSTALNTLDKPGEQILFVINQRGG